MTPNEYNACDDDEKNMYYHVHWFYFPNQRKQLLAAESSRLLLIRHEPWKINPKKNIIIFFFYCITNLRVNYYIGIKLILSWYMWNPKKMWVNCWLENKHRLRVSRRHDRLWLGFKASEFSIVNTIYKIEWLRDIEYGSRTQEAFEEAECP